MQNNHPKSEGPALKEAAAKAKDKQGLEKSIEREKKHHNVLPSTNSNLAGKK
jgi:hypothetical protein